MRGISGKKPLGRPRRRWDDNIRINLQKVGWGRDMDWIDLAQASSRWWVLVNVVINLQVPQKAGNILTI